jgi:hypothetical protein
MHALSGYRKIRHGVNVEKRHAWEKAGTSECGVSVERGDDDPAGPSDSGDHAAVVWLAKAKGWVSDEHFPVDAT